MTIGHDSMNYEEMAKLAVAVNTSSSGSCCNEYLFAMGWLRLVGFLAL